MLYKMRWIWCFYTTINSSWSDILVLSVGMDPVEHCYKVAEETLEVSELISVKDFLLEWQGILPCDEFELQDCPSLPLKSFPDIESVFPKDILEELFIVTKWEQISVTPLWTKSLYITSIVMYATVFVVHARVFILPT